MIRKLFYWTCPAPLLFFGGVWLYVTGYDGWGAWAAAPMFLGPILLSLMMGGLGAVMIVLAAQRREPTAGLWAATLVAGSLFLYVMATAILEELIISFR